jgi:uncharacterized protein YjbI with pentapeptide repeats
LLPAATAPSDRVALIQDLLAVANREPGTTEVSNPALGALLEFIRDRSHEPGAAADKADLLYALRTVGALTPAFAQTPDLSKSLADARLAGLDLRGLHFNDIDFTGADLAGSDLAGDELNGDDFTRADLRGADLRDTRIDMPTDRTSFDGADLTGAFLDCRGLAGALDVTAKQLASARLDPCP